MGRIGEDVMKRDPAFLSAAVLVLLLAFTAPAWANGEEFFAPAKNGKIDLVYFGRIKDSRTGRSVSDSVYFLLTDKATGLSFPFTNDKPGHYRSPDIGAAIKEIGEAVNVNAFEIAVNVAGYKKTMIAKVPRKTQGAVELEVRLEPDDSSAVATAGVGSIDTRTWIVLIGFFLLLVILKAARTSGRLLTTKR
jgi:hypothetical protein